MHITEKQLRNLIRKESKKVLLERAKEEIKTVLQEQRRGGKSRYKPVDPAKTKAFRAAFKAARKVGLLKFMFDRGAPGGELPYNTRIGKEDRKTWSRKMRIRRRKAAANPPKASDLVDPYDVPAIDADQGPPTVEPPVTDQGPPTVEPPVTDQGPPTIEPPVTDQGPPTADPAGPVETGKCRPGETAAACRQRIATQGMDEEPDPGDQGTVRFLSEFCDFGLVAAFEHAKKRDPKESGTVAKMYQELILKASMSNRECPGAEIYKAKNPTPSTDKPAPGAVKPILPQLVGKDLLRERGAFKFGREDIVLFFDRQFMNINTLGGVKGNRKLKFKIMHETGQLDFQQVKVVGAGDSVTMTLAYTIPEILGSGRTTIKKGTGNVTEEMLQKWLPLLLRGKPVKETIGEDIVTITPV